MAIDLSSSIHKDLKPNRMEALKEAVATVVEDQIDRIGIVVYAGGLYKTSTK
jgi:hypothetical protein